jgi:hypothetical protein
MASFGNRNVQIPGIASTVVVYSYVLPMEIHETVLKFSESIFWVCQVEILSFVEYALIWQVGNEIKVGP